MLRFWRNPEFVRHVRAELRPTRALTAGILVVIICALIGLACWSGNRDNPRRVMWDFYWWVLGAQFVVLLVWSASACGQAVSKERELKTYDFLKTTRLTSLELLVGKLLGTPVMASFVVVCSLPVSVITGSLAGIRLRALVETYLLLAATALFVSLVGLWGSMLVEKSSLGSVGLLSLIPVGLAYSLVDSAFPGLAGLSVFPALFTIYNLKEFDATRVAPTLFGGRCPFLFITLVLYVSLGAWFVLMLSRNLKKDREEIRLLARWQAVGFAGFINLLSYALLDPGRVRTNFEYGSMTPGGVSILAVALNACILYSVGLAMVSPPEKLKVWWRKYASGGEAYFSEKGLPWPWLVPAAAIGYALLVAEAAGLGRGSFAQDWRLGMAGLQLVVCLVFTVRDILFIQWCNLTRMKRPSLKGVLYLLLYYGAAGIVCAVISAKSSSQASFAGGLLTPFGAWASESPRLGRVPGVYAGLVLQGLAIGYVLRAITARLRRAPVVAAVGAPLPKLATHG